MEEEEKEEEEGKEGEEVKEEEEEEKEDCPVFPSQAKNINMRQCWDPNISFRR